MNLLNFCYIQKWINHSTYQSINVQSMKFLKDSGVSISLLSNCFFQQIKYIAQYIIVISTNQIQYIHYSRISFNVKITTVNSAVMYSGCINISFKIRNLFYKHYWHPWIFKFYCNLWLWFSPIKLKSITTCLTFWIQFLLKRLKRPKNGSLMPSFLNKILLFLNPVLKLILGLSILQWICVILSLQGIFVIWRRRWLFH